ncbi:pyridoxal kinase PdxY [Ferruginivarius sediminum]|uniref:pyridoxal kinase n=1 Tax=Ferruginivarius sediminum TaxID=2661937 RepID=A0A369TFY8_9PROT|nr:pyridoxal kinase PdxY [Ferruginivarius sediminum]RDD63514.1 pyridoxal kinase PdxY [Ferruginivarius sediminum]
MPVICLNSHVAFGYVGNDAAAFCLRRLGIEAWQVDTVIYSNHPGYGGCTGRVVPPCELRALMAGLQTRGSFNGCRGILTGYIGAAQQGDEMLAAIAAVRRANPEAVAVVDPIIGDSGPGLYVAPEVAAFFAEEAVPRADVVTPNAFELGHLTGRDVAGIEDAVSAARSIIARGPRIVLVTSLPLGTDTLLTLAVTDEDAWSLQVPRLDFPVPPNGAGDAMAGLFTAHLLRGSPLPDALADSANAIHAVLEATQASGRRELDLVCAQDALAAPPRRFRAQAL